MARYKMNMGMAIAFALCAVSLLSLAVFSVPDAHAATAFTAGAATPAFFGSLKMAGVLAALQLRRDDLKSKAEAKRAEIKTDTPAEDAARIETEHAALTEQLRAVTSEIAAEEERLRSEQQAELARQQAADAARNAAQTTQTQPAPGAPDAVAAERARSASILSLGAQLGRDELARSAVAAGDTVDQFRARLTDAMAAEHSRQPNTRPQVSVHDNAQVDAARAAAIENALMHRADPSNNELSADGRNFRGMTLLEMAREVVEANGVRTRGMARIELAGVALQSRGSGMMAVDDFPNILANIANKTLRAGYDAAPQTFRPLVRVVTVPDFKQVSRVQLGEAPQLEKVTEHGEFKRGSMGEAAEKYAVSTYGKIVAITRQVLVNDDLSAFTRIPRSFGVQAAALESDLVWAIITSNPNMADGVALFHASHKNLAGSGAAISAASVGAARQAMRNQTGVDGKTLLNISPTYIVGPTALETTIEQFLGPIVPTQSSNVVPATMKKLVPITEPRLDAASASNWFLAADNAQIDTIELAYLEGAQGVYTETRMGFDVDGVEVKVRMDVGAKAIDWRGLYKNPN